MIMKKIYSIFFLFFVFRMVSAQFSFEYSSGYGAYLQKGEIKDLLAEKLSTVQETLPNAKIVANFPNYFTYSFGMNYVYKKEEFGLTITRLSTGGKISYADYSGEYTNKLTLSATRIGTRYRYDYIDSLVFAKKRFILFGEISPGVIISSLKNRISEKYSNETVSEANDDDCSCVMFSLQPQIGVRTTIFKRFGIFATIGVDLDYGGTLSDDNATKISWLGPRASIGISYTLPPKKNKPKKKKEDDEY